MIRSVRSPVFAMMGLIIGGTLGLCGCTSGRHSPDASDGDDHVVIAEEPPAPTHAPPAPVHPPAPTRPPPPAGVAVDVSVAANEPVRHNPPKGDLDSLKARLVETDSGPALDISCEVEIEHTEPGDLFDLVISIREGSQVLRDPQGRVIRPVMPLSEPTKVKKDELQFRPTLLVPLPPGAFQHPSQVKVSASVYWRNTGQRIEHVEKYIKY